MRDGSTLGMRAIRCPTTDRTGAPTFRDSQAVPAIHRGSPRLWRWQTAVWAPLPLYVFFFWHQSDLAGALLVAFVLWTITGGRTPRES